MDINKFILKRPYLYHLTDRANLDTILDQRTLLSTTSIVAQSAIDDGDAFLRRKRNTHFRLDINGQEYNIRDQKPISELVLARSLESGCTSEDYLHLLNSRVFFWPTLNRLERHYKRYVNETPIILVLNTADTFAVNRPPLFSRLNSGATRCSSHWNGNAPIRGFNTFLNAESFDYGLGAVAEVTFEERCNLPESLYYIDSPSEEPRPLN